MKPTQDQFILTRPGNKLLLIILLCSSCFISYADDSKQPVKSSPQIASVGIFVVNVYQLDMSTNSFYADFYLWCRWKGTIDPFKNLEFANSQEQSEFSRVNLQDTPAVSADGHLYSSIHVQGRFHHSFILNRYPMDKQKVSIQLENSIYTTDELLYRPDSANSNIEPAIAIPGWEIDRFSISNTPHIYNTNFGQPEIMANDSYSNLSFSLELHRPTQYFFWKLLLPIIIVLLSSLGAPIIFPGYVDARIYAPIGALLTTVFLQQSYSSQLPDISYLVLTDKLYVVVYISILAGIFHAIYTANLVKRGSEDGIKKARKLDRIYIAVILSFLAISSSLLIFQ